MLRTFIKSRATTFAIAAAAFELEGSSFYDDWNVCNSSARFAFKCKVGEKFEHS